MRPNYSVFGLVLAAVIGLWFSAVSTYDFVAHLDRQVHGIHCSFLPGLSAPVADGGGCQVTLMSPYSSVLRSTVWGGIPISLPAMSVFAFLLFWSISLLIHRNERDPRAATFTLLAASLPFVASLAMGYISLVTLGTACKQCIGIYSASTLAFVSALLLFLAARKPAQANEPAPTPTSLPALGVAFGAGVLFVSVPVATYAASAPDFSRFIGTCGQLESSTDDAALVALGASRGATTMVEVLDPLCPSCRGFEDRFSKLSLSQEITRKALLFPLDNKCNWMVTEAIHPGACAVSEAVLCAGDQAESVLHWAFDNQERILEAAKKDPDAAGRMVGAQFPSVAKCIGSASARAKLNRALRYAVKNRLHVLTPQVYVEGLRLCDEDTDLGLEHALPRLIARARSASPTTQGAAR